MKQANYLEEQEVLNKVESVTGYLNREFLPGASVIIVTYNSRKKLLQQCLESLRTQTRKDFEILIIDNSDRRPVQKLVSAYPVMYIKLQRNYGLSVGRNIGIHYARGEIVIFLDDDAVPAGNFVEEHMTAYDQYDIFGLRGKAVPRTRNSYNHLAQHYDFGDKAIPCYINLEGNSSFKRSILVATGGFNPRLESFGGYEGLELSYRIMTGFGDDKRRLLYYPGALIYHDFTTTALKYFKKVLRHRSYREIIQHAFPSIMEFAADYNLNQYRKTSTPPDAVTRAKIAVINKLASFITSIQG